MANQFSPSLRLCATCEFWGGPRSAKFLRTKVECDLKTVGVCYQTGSSQLKRGPTNSCSKWKKWGVLK